MRVSVGDVELHVHEKGEGRPSVVSVIFNIAAIYDGSPCGNPL